MSSPRLFSNKSQNIGHHVTRRVFLDGLVDTINCHVIGTHLLKKDEINSINTHFSSFTASEKEYIREQITPFLSNWKVESELYDSLAFSSMLRMLGGTIVGAAVSELIFSVTDNFAAGLLAGMAISLAIGALELQALQEPANRNHRMYDFINSLESCGIQVPVMNTFFEFLRQLSKKPDEQGTLQQEAQHQLRPRFA